MVRKRFLPFGKQAELVKSTGSVLVKRVFSRFIFNGQTELRQHRAQLAEIDNARDRLLGDAW